MIDKSSVEKTFSTSQYDIIVHLAAQAGVRYSIENPHETFQTNVIGFNNIIENCINYSIKKFIYASSSSVYGGNGKFPFSISDRVDMPISLYAVTKRTNELTAYAYNKLYGLNSIGLRFFTVYGPWGRPDMAMYHFANKIIKNKEIEVYNHGKMLRDYTYIDDIVDGIVSCIISDYSYEIFNLGNGKSEDLMTMIQIIEEELGLNARIKFKEIQLGDVKKTHANIDNERKKLSYEPKVNIQKGIPKFIKWFKTYHNIN